MPLADLLSPFEALTVATAVAILAQAWRMNRARKDDQKERETRIVERTQAAAAVEHRLADLEREREAHTREGQAVVRRLGEIDRKLTVVETTGQAVLERLTRLEGRRNGSGQVPGI